MIGQTNKQTDRQTDNTTLYIKILDNSKFVRITNIYHRLTILQFLFLRNYYILNKGYIRILETLRHWFHY